jgi:G3E family GTPase
LFWSHLGRRINRSATVIETEKTLAPLGKILGLHSFNMESILDYDPSFFDNQEDTGHNLELVQLVGIEFKGNLHAQWFNMFVIDLLRERAPDLYRSAFTRRRFRQYFTTQEESQKLFMYTQHLYKAFV